MSAGEILLILVIYLLLFGAKGIPSLAQTLGKAVYQFKNATRDVQDEIMKSAQEIRKETQAVRLDQMDIDDTKNTSPSDNRISRAAIPTTNTESPSESPEQPSQEQKS